MIRRVALLVALILVLAFGAWKQQDAPLRVTCGSVSGGSTATVKGVEWARKGGSWLHNVARNPEQYRDPDSVQRTLDGMFRKVLWFWIKAGVQSARGEKIDPQIIKLEQDRAQAVKDAGAACCPTTPPAPEDEPPADEPAEDWDPRMASFSRSEFSRENLDIAKVAVREARRAGLPERAAVVNLAAGFQESGVRNLDYGHSSSVGYLQLIDTHGSVAQRINPTFSARWFYRGLKDVQGWQQMSVTRAAQAVQRSAYPDAYAKWEDDARELLAAAGGFGAAAVPDDPEAPGYTAGGCVPVGEDSEVDISDGRRDVTPSPDGWDFPNQSSVDAAIGWMRSQDARNTGGWQARCLAAVGQAYGHPGTYTADGTYYASEQLTLMPRQYRLASTVDPPRGALVFRKTGAAAGHISISNGDGREWTTDPPGRTGQIGLVSSKVLDTWGERTGVTAPWFPGMTGDRA